MAAVEEAAEEELAEPLEHAPLADLGHRRANRHPGVEAHGEALSHGGAPVDARQERVPSGVRGEVGEHGPHGFRRGLDDDLGSNVSRHGSISLSNVVRQYVYDD